MVSTQEAVFAARFGLSALPRHGGPVDAHSMLDRLSGADHIAAALPLPPFAEAIEATAAAARLRSGEDAPELDPVARQARIGELRNTRLRRNLLTTLARGVGTEDPLRERLTWFWADHFTAVGRRYDIAGAQYVNDTIRPHLTGSFRDLLRAASLHVFMLDYLDQLSSVGPNSEVGQRRGLGLNENYARELLELHTLGVGGPYGQQDVRQLALLLAGLSATPEGLVHLDPRRGARGAETVLGKRYGIYQPGLDAVHDLLDDLARHPATARHLAHKLAVHFVAPRPDPALVDRLTTVFLDTDGHLLSVYEALLTHPAAQSPERAKVRTPFEYLTASLIALDYPADALAGMPQSRIWGFLLGPLRAMGQPWESPGGPDGWPEDPAAWINPVGLAERMAWALRLDQYLPDLPDPRLLAERALGPLAGPEVRLAAAAAESQREGVALVLLSPQFQRR